MNFWRELPGPQWLNAKQLFDPLQWSQQNCSIYFSSRSKTLRRITTLIKTRLATIVLKAMLNSDKSAFKTETEYDLSSGIAVILAMVHETIAVFKHDVEKGNSVSNLGEPPEE